MCDRQAESRALPDWLGAEERLEDPLEHLGCDPCPGVPHLDENTSPLRIRPEPDSSFTYHRLHRVCQEIKQDLVEVTGVADGVRDVAVLALDADAVAPFPAQQLERPLEAGVDVSGRVSVLRCASESHELAHDACRTRGTVPADAGVLGEDTEALGGLRSRRALPVLAQFQRRGVYQIDTGV